jgi:hypothetical protein
MRLIVFEIQYSTAICVKECQISTESQNLPKNTKFNSNIITSVVQCHQQQQQPTPTTKTRKKTK